MGLILRKDFSRGWVPSMDSVNCPENGLLRMDNLVLDEQNVLALRLGSSKVNANAFADTDIHSLFTVNISGTRYRMSGATNKVYANGSALATTFAGSNDIAFGAYLGNIFMARSTTKRKYDGTNNYQWGITAPAAPTVTVSAGPSVIGASYDTGPTITLNEGVAGSSGFCDDRSGTVPPTTPGTTNNLAYLAKSDATTFRATLTRAWPAITNASNATPIEITTATQHDRSTGDKVTITGVLGNTNANGTWVITKTSATTFTLNGSSGNAAYVSGGVFVLDATYLSDGTTATDSDTLEMYVYVDDPTLLTQVELMVDVNDGTFNVDSYRFIWGINEEVPLSLPDEQLLDSSFTFTDATGTARAIDNEELRAARQRLFQRQSQVRVSAFRPDKQVWNYISAKRGDFERIGSTGGKDWTTVKAIRITYLGTAQTILAFDALKVVGGGLHGTYIYRTQYVNETTAYNATSPLSAPAASIAGDNVSFTVTWLASSDAQVTHVYVYRMGGTLDTFYRVQRIAIGTTSVADSTPDTTAIITNITAGVDDAVPPDNIIGIVEDYYYRLLCLTTTHLYPSRRLNPDSFSAGQAIRIADGTATAYWIRKALGGVYIGTSRDIYRVDGDLAELPDGTINVRVTPVNIAYPPISAAIASEGNYIVYLASDGWRNFTGQDSIPLKAETDLLWRGYTRHGVSPPNVTSSSARFRGAISNGVLVALTPEGTSTTSSTALWKHVFVSQRWYRHTYTPSFRTVYREPDGTILAGDNAGFVWQLETGTQDDGSNISITKWTKVDDNGQPRNRKDPWDYAVELDTGGANTTINLHLDGSSTSIVPLTASSSGVGTYQSTINNIGVFREIQQRITGSFSTFKLYNYAIQYRERPTITVFAENRPLVAAQNRRRFDGLSIRIDTLGGLATVIPVIDGVDQASQTVQTLTPITKDLTFAPVAGRDLWARVSLSTGFELYGIEPIIAEQLPPLFRGLTQQNNLGTPCEKVISGIEVRACTLGAARVFTPYLDRVAQSTTFTLTTGANEPQWYTYQFGSPQTIVDSAISVDGDVELYEWKPKLLYLNPCYRQIWDTGPIDLQIPDLGWIRKVQLKAKIPVSLTVTPYLDGTSQATQNLAVNGTANKVTVYDLYLGREAKARQVRFIFDAGAPNVFQPYWVQLLYRASGLVSEKKTVRIKASI